MLCVAYVLVASAAWCGECRVSDHNAYGDDYIDRLCREISTTRETVNTELMCDESDLCKLRELWKCVYSKRNSPNVVGKAMTAITKRYGSDEKIGFALLLTQADGDGRLCEKYDACIVLDAIEIINDDTKILESKELKDAYKEKLVAEGLISRDE